MKPKISIIIPVYHVEQYIMMCLQSVANQTMTEGIECIIVDDCGDDKSIDLAREFVENYKGKIDFKIVYREQNGGLSAARNSGIEAARGEYLYFLDSDDEITPDCMELMYSLIEKYGKVDLVQGSFYETNKEKETASPYDIPEYTDDQRQIKSFLLRYEGDIVGAQSRLVKREFLIKHNLIFKDGIIHEDNYWTFFLAKYVLSMAFCPIRTYYHRYNPTSITGNVNVHKEALAYREIITDFTKNVDPFLRGHQKELILNNLITVLKCHFYETDTARKELINLLIQSHSIIENLLFRIYIASQNSKILHLLIRMYKVKD